MIHRPGLLAGRGPVLEVSANSVPGSNSQTGMVGARIGKAKKHSPELIVNILQQIEGILPAKLTADGRAMR